MIKEMSAEERAARKRADQLGQECENVRAVLVFIRQVCVPGNEDGDDPAPDVDFTKMAPGLSVVLQDVAARIDTVEQLGEDLCQQVFAPSKGGAR
jgi:hypothetical protein